MSNIKSTSVNGILKWLQLNHPNSKMVMDFKLSKNKLFFINSILKKYRESRGSRPSQYLHKNAMYVQRDFGSFINYINNKVNEEKNMC